MNENKTIETMNLFLLPSCNNRDNEPFLKMLKEDGDFRIFSGIDYSDRHLMIFDNYFENNGCFYSIFSKENPEEFLGYVGIGYQSNRYEVEFYISKEYRNRGYCTEALQKISTEALKGNLLWNKENSEQCTLHIAELYATTIAKNDPTIKVLEKCGYNRNKNIAFAALVLVDPDNDDTHYENEIVEYVLRKGNERTIST